MAPRPPPHPRGRPVTALTYIAQAIGCVGIVAGLVLMVTTSPAAPHRPQKSPLHEQDHD